MNTEWEEVDEFDDAEEWGDDDGGQYEYDLGPGDWLEDLDSLRDVIPLFALGGN